MAARLSPARPIDDILELGYLLPPGPSSGMSRHERAKRLGVDPAQAVHYERIARIFASLRGRNLPLDYSALKVLAADGVHPAIRDLAIARAERGERVTKGSALSMVEAGVGE
jgi:hypothetical protein